MADHWRSRVFTAAEAAALSGLKRSQLDVWVNRQPAELFSEKRGHNRWFSPMDISILALARQLERAGKSLLMAIGMAYEHIEGEAPPAPDAILVVEAERMSARAGRFIPDRDIARLAIDKTIILIPAGAIVAGIIAACEKLRAA